MLAKISNWLETSEILIQLINFFLTFYNQLSTLVQLHSSIIIHYQLRTSLFALVPHTRITSLMNAALDQWLISACKKKISCPGSPIPTLTVWLTHCHFRIFTQSVTLQTSNLCLKILVALHSTLVSRWVSTSIASRIASLFSSPATAFQDIFNCKI